ncbi:hypothetical protein WISP_132736 [Willisornis vidua]|uniref:Uncharacterized protein n=1 Tax=Willisornis vidua TaxID=1566151 RepID=A0ABQ9CQ63_9PASS|nr:hypothetical protein WISP_132736 [Willisornis vidua]
MSAKLVLNTLPYPGTEDFIQESSDQATFLSSLSLSSSGYPVCFLPTPPPPQSNSKVLREVIGKGLYPLVLPFLFA